MIYTYIVNKDEDGNVFSINRSDGVSIPVNESNSDYQAYLATLASESTPTGGNN